MVRFYSVGTELHLTDYQHGWFQVLDPVTSQRGWIYEKYYLQAIRGPGQMVAALQEPVNPEPEVVKARKPTPHMKRAKKIGPRQARKNHLIQAHLATDTRLWPVSWTRHFDRSEASRTSVAIRSALHLLALQPHLMEACSDKWAVQGAAKSQRTDLAVAGTTISSSWPSACRQAD